MRRYWSAMGRKLERDVVPVMSRKDPAISQFFVTNQTCLMIQPMRCGGTLLTQLLDGCRVLNVRPYHYVPARSSTLLNGETWPTDEEVNAACKTVADLWREFVYDPRFYEFRTKGLPMRMERRDVPAPPVIIDIRASDYYSAFRAALSWNRANTPPFRVEPVVGAAFAGFFSVWRNRKLPPHQKMWNVSHAPRFATTGNYALACQNFLDSMPNGKLVTSVRKPENWIASHTRAGIRNDTIEDAIKFYEDFLTQADRISSDRRLLVRFEDLIANTEATIRKILDHLKVDHEFFNFPCVPTQDGVRVRGTNTSFPDQKHDGIINRSTLDRSGIFSPAELSMIRERLNPLYDKLFA